MHGNLGMASKRKKLVTARTPGGRVSRAGEEREYPPTQVKRLRDAAMVGLKDPEWGTELGRLYLHGTITEAMYAAGKRWAELASKYQKAIGVFPIRSLSAEPGIRAAQPDPDSTDGRKIAEREANAAERFFEAHAVLVSCGKLVETCVRKLCEEDQQLIGMEELIKARTGLLRLASHWGLTGVRKSDSGRDR